MSMMTMMMLDVLQEQGLGHDQRDNVSCCLNAKEFLGLQQHV